MSDYDYPDADAIPSSNPKPAMTDHAQVDVAEQVIRDVHKELPEVWLGGRQRYVLVEAITKALTQTHAAGRWEGLEDLADKLESEVKYEASDEAYDNEVGKDGDGTSYNQGVMACIKWIRAKVKEAGHE